MSLLGVDCSRSSRVQAPYRLILVFDAALATTRDRAAPSSALLPSHSPSIRSATAAPLWNEPVRPSSGLGACLGW